MTRMINVYINGTDERSESVNELRLRTISTNMDDFKLEIKPTTSLANVLHALTATDDERSSFCLHGCGISNPYQRDLGAIFTWNLAKQVKDLEKTIRRKLDPLNPIVLNLYGFSRGAAGVYLLCQQLKDIPVEQLQINLLAFEPVPGNFMRGTYVDKSLRLNQTLSSQISDLSDCQNIRNAYALFTCKPLPDIACHGPILPVMPQDCNHVVDVIPGCHKNAELFEFDFSGRQPKISPYNDQSAIAFHQVIDFLQKCGTRFELDVYDLSKALTDKSLLLDNYRMQMKRVEEEKRDMHFGNKIITYKNSKGRDFLNLHHQAISGYAEDPKACLLVVKDPNPKSVHTSYVKPLVFSGMVAEASIDTYLACQSDADAETTQKSEMSTDSIKSMCRIS